jgi:putative ABC transport system ATP-binding protein
MTVAADAAAVENASAQAVMKRKAMSSNPEAPIIKAVNLGKQVSTGDTGLTILADISFEVRGGESVAVVGVSGSGKSTLLALLAGLDTPSTGTVRVDGHDLYALDEDGRAALRGRMAGFVFQSFQLLPAMTALENVMLPMELAGAPEARYSAQAMLERVGLGARLHHYPRQLSGGEQQRVAIGRAFVTRPRLLFADEPTGNLDPATGAQVIELLFGLNRENRTTLLMVTHDEALTRRCDRVLRLSAGRLLDDSH